MNEKNINIPNIQTELSKLRVLLRYNQDVANRYFYGAEKRISNPNERKELRRNYFRIRDTIQPKKINNPEEYCYLFDLIAELESQFQIGLMEGEACFKKLSQNLVISASYNVLHDEYKDFREEAIKRIEGKIYSKLVVSVEAADEYYLSCSPSPISREEYDQLKRDFLLSLLKNKVTSSIREADSYYATIANTVLIK